MENKIYIFIIVFFLLFSCSNNKNFENIKKIEKGMNIEEAIEKMEKRPFKKDDAYWDKSLFIYYYESPFLASDHYQLIFRKCDSILVDIDYGE